GERRRKRGPHRAERKQAHRNYETRMPAPQIGDDSDQPGADDVADQAQRDRPGSRIGRDAELANDFRQGRGDVEDVVESEEIGGPENPQELVAPRPDRDTVEP